MKNAPLEGQIIDNILEESRIADIGNATIREVVTVVNKVEAATGFKYVRMEMGVPSLPPPEIGTNAEIAALQSGVASKYPMLDGHPELKKEASRFIKAFLDIDVNSANCIPVVGSMQGTYASFITCLQRDNNRDTVLFIDPGFPVQKQQLTVLGYKWRNFDLFYYRGEKMAEILDEMLADGKVSCIIYSNPNNPSWVCLTDRELQIIAQKAEQYQVIILEDLAYFAMDFRKDLGMPFEAPFQATVAKYTSNYILLISSSKAFSYAGQRIGIAAISDTLYQQSFADLQNRYGVDRFGEVFVNRVLYALSSGTSHSAQYALAAMLKAASNGEFRFVEVVKEYGRRAEFMKALFLSHGFELVYDKDMEEPLANGFYFTLKYKNLTGAELSARLIYYGISAISLSSTGSKQQGIRACTAFVTSSQFPDLEDRLKRFSADNA